MFMNSVTNLPLKLVLRKTIHFATGIYKMFYIIVDNNRNLQVLTKLPPKISNTFTD